MTPPSVKVISHKGCPNHRPCLELVQEIIEDLSLEISAQEVIVEDPARAEALGYRGSPTVLVNGRDILPAPSQGVPALACRLYDSQDGLPPRKAIQQALQDPSGS